MNEPRPPRPLPHRMLLIIGSIGPLGHLPASGTATVAIVGVPLFWRGAGWRIETQLAVALALTVAAMFIHQMGDRLLGEKDSRKLVWDELVGFWIAVLAVPFTWQSAVAAFLMERALDIAKVPPAGWIERRWPGAWGVVGDDVVAGLYALAAMHVLLRLYPTLLGLA